MLSDLYSSLHDDDHIAFIDKQLKKQYHTKHYANKYIAIQDPNNSDYNTSPDNQSLFTSILNNFNNYSLHITPLFRTNFIAYFMSIIDHQYQDFTPKSLLSYLYLSIHDADHTAFISKQLKTISYKTLYEQIYCNSRSNNSDYNPSPDNQ